MVLIWRQDQLRHIGATDKAQLAHLDSEKPAKA
jgi:hypothetical protein